jgi:hypothetical protein
MPPVGAPVSVSIAVDGLASQLRIALRPRHLTQYLHIVNARAGAGGAARQSLRRKLALPPKLCSEERGQLGVRSRLGRRTLPATPWASAAAAATPTANCSTPAAGRPLRRWRWLREGEESFSTLLVEGGVGLATAPPAALLPASTMGRDVAFVDWTGFLSLQSAHQKTRP